MEAKVNAKSKKISFKKLNKYIRTYAENCRYSFNMMLML